MRISDWSSDVCASDLIADPERRQQQLRHRSDIQDMTGTISGKRQQRLRFEMKFMVVIILDDSEPELACKVQQPKPALGTQRNGGRELVVRSNEHSAHRIAAAGPLDRFDVDHVERQSTTLNFSH